MEDFALYAMYRSAATDHGFVTATWEGLTNKNRDVWTVFAERLGNLEQETIEDALAGASEGTKAGERTD